MSNALRCSNPSLGTLRCVTGDGFVEAEDPIGHRESQFHEPADGHPARNLAAGVASHAIGDHHGVADFLCPFGYLPGWQAGEHCLQISPDAGHDEVVFVAGSHLARMRQSADIDQQGRRERRPNGVVRNISPIFSAVPRLSRHHTENSR